MIPTHESDDAQPEVLPLGSSGRRPYSARRSGDRFTILQVILVTVGAAVGLTIASNVRVDFESLDNQKMRALAVTTLMGLSLVACFLTLRRHWRGNPLGLGGLLNLSIGWAMVLVGPALVIEFTSIEDDLPSIFLFVYVVPLLPLWGVLAGLVCHRIDRRRLGPANPWTERLGLYLAFLWSLLGVWVLVDVYGATF